MKYEGDDNWVLVVDDNESIRILLSLMLAEARCRVLTASNGAEAIEILRTQPVDILITDYDMPRMNGLELIRWCKACLPHVGMVLITGHDDPALAATARNSGVQRVFLKPFPIEELLAVVEEIRLPGPVFALAGNTRPVLA